MRRTYLMAGAGLAALGLAYAMRPRHDDDRPPDSAPGNAAKRGFGADKVVASAVTIHAAQDRVIEALANDPDLPAAMAGQPGISLTPIDHADGSDILSWRTEDGDLVKLRVRPVRGGAFTAVTGILALEGGRLGAAIAPLVGKSPKQSLRHALTEARMRIEAGEVALAGPSEAATKG
jgi:hypothetical protein